MTQYIDITPTWAEAARIYTLALENGTPTGQQAAREGIAEMAQKLDQLIAGLRTDKTEKTRVGLTEIIASHPERKDALPWGVTFHDDAEAMAYDTAMTAAGYATELCGYYTAKSAKDALTDAAKTFDDDRLEPAQ